MSSFNKPIIVHREEVDLSDEIDTSIRPDENTTSDIGQNHPSDPRYVAADRLIQEHQHEQKTSTGRIAYVLQQDIPPPYRSLVGQRLLDLGYHPDHHLGSNRGRVGWKKNLPVNTTNQPVTPSLDEPDTNYIDYLIRLMQSEVRSFHRHYMIVENLCMEMTLIYSSWKRRLRLQGIPPI